MNRGPSDNQLNLSAATTQNCFSPASPCIIPRLVPIKEIHAPGHLGSPIVHSGLIDMGHFRSVKPRQSTDRDVASLTEVRSFMKSKYEPQRTEMARGTERGSQQTKLQSTLDCLEDYSLNTSVHGIRYIFERRRHWSERLWWLIAVTLSLVVCLWQINQLFRKWDNSPVIVSLAGKSKPIWDIPFPAVTICSETKANRTELDYKDIFYKMYDHGFNPCDGIVSEDELRKFQSMQEVCGVNKPERTYNGTIDGNIGDILRDIAVMRNIAYADYHEEYLEGPEFFQTMTQEGVCYTFNMLSPKQFYQDGVVNEIHGVANHSYDDYFDSLPHRSFQAGVRGGLFAVMEHERKDFTIVCGYQSNGYRFLLHPPDEFPQIHLYYNFLQLEKSLMVGIIPTVQSTSEELRKYHPAQRQCFFNHERTLKFFRVYTQRNCELECLTNYTLYKCGCVRLGMPRFKTTKNCDASNRECYWNAKYKLQRYSLNEDKAGRPKNNYCDCLPSCLAISYDAEISQTDWKMSETIDYDPKSKEYNKIFKTAMTVFFKEKQFTESRRSELYGPSDFLANFGGSLCLFMGISLLSAVEVIYFCTLRLFFNIRRQRVLQPDSPVRQRGDNEIA